MSGIACWALFTLIAADNAKAATLENFHLFQENGAPGNAFGASIAAWGNTIAIGGATTGNSGQVSVYVKTNGAWELEQTLALTAIPIHMEWGHALALSGDTLVVSAPGADTGSGVDAGLVYVYERSAGVWAQQAVLTASDASAGKRFGGSVDFDGRTLAVGAYSSALDAPAPGAVYLFQRDGGTWTQVAQIQAPGLPAAALFGWRVAVDGGVLAVSASQEDYPGTAKAGSVYVFEESGNQWPQQAKLIATTPEKGPGFGHSLALSGGLLLVGAPFHARTGDPQESGFVYCFSKSGETWGLQQRMTGSAVTADHWFGYSLDFLGDVAVIGSPRSVESEFGHAQFYRYENSQLRHGATIRPSDGQFGDRFATSIVLTANTVVIGAPDDGTAAGEKAGSVYLIPNGMAEPVITSTYPVRGTAPGTARVHFGVSTAPGGPLTTLGETVADGDGAFLSDLDTLPYVGQYLTATAELDGLFSEPSAPVLIESPCPLPAAADSPYPADGATLVEPGGLLLAWDDLPVKSAKGISAETTSADAACEIPPGRPFSKGEDGGPMALEDAPDAAKAGTISASATGSAKDWEPVLTNCAAPLDIEAFGPDEGVLAWDGESFARQGVVFSPEAGSRLFLARDEIERGYFEAYIMSTTSTTRYPANAATAADFLVPVTCVSLDVLDVDEVSAPWTVYAYDAGGTLIAQRSDVAERGKFKLEFPGIRRVIFEPSTEYEGMFNFAFSPIACPVTFDVFFGESPVTMTKICADATSPACTPPALDTYTTYYWQVIAKGVRGDTAGPIWSFTTRPVTVARNDTFVMLEDAGAATFNVLANDTNDAGPLTVSSFTTPGAGTLTKNADNTFSYLPPTSFSGQVQFTYTVPSGGPGSVTTATVGIVVLSANDPPVVRYPVPDLTYSLNPAPVGVNAELVFLDIDNDVLAYTVTQNSNPALVTISRSGAGFTLAFTPDRSGICDITLRATDPAGAFAEDTFRVTVGTIPTPPEITQQPAAQTVNYRDAAQFTCAATSNVALSYRWQFNGFDVADGAKYAGAGTSQLTVLGCENADEGLFRCRVSNGSIAKNTASARLTVRDPYILGGPDDATGGIGGTASFQVTAVGSGALSYRWFIGDTPLADGPKYSGAATGRLTVKDLIDLPLNTDEQLYRVEVRGADPDPVLSRAALLTISDPAITIQPEPLTVREGTTARFSIVAIGTPPILYRWKKNGITLSDNGRYSGTRTPELTITGAVEADEGDYSCTAVGQEIVESRPARLTVTQIPAITGIRVTPANGIVPRGGAFSVELLLDGPTDGLTFEWHRDTAGVSDGPRITGATTPLLSVTAAEDGDAGNYTCTVRQGAEALTSPPGLVRVGLAFSVDLDDVALEAGQRFEWRTELTGAEFAVTYSWFRQTTSKAFQPLRDNERISGTDSSTLVIDPVSYGDAGQYVVYALDGADIAVSSIATMTVSESVPVLGALGLAMAAAALGLAGARARRRQA